MHAISARLQKYGLRYDDLYDPYHHLGIKEALARRPREVCLVPSPRIASSRPTASSARSSRRRGARPEGTRGSTDPSCSSFKQVIALPLPHQPLFPGFYMPIYVKDQKLLQALVENGKRLVPYVGAFLVKDEEVTDPNIMTSSDSEKCIDDLKGKELLRRLHEVGTLAQHSWGSGSATWSPTFTDKRDGSGGSTHSES